MSSASVPGDLVATWDLHLPDGIHTVKFEHGTTSGKRVVSVDDKEVLRKNWMFKLVGRESFVVGSRAAEVRIISRGLGFEYELCVDGKSISKFVETHNRNTRTWLPIIGGQPHRIVLEIDKMEVYADGKIASTFGEFAEEGTETRFMLGSQSAIIKTVSSGNKKKGLLYTLVVNGEEFQPVLEIPAV